VRWRARVGTGRETAARPTAAQCPRHACQRWLAASAPPPVRRKYSNWSVMSAVANLWACLFKHKSHTRVRSCCAAPQARIITARQGARNAVCCYQVKGTRATHACVCSFYTAYSEARW
jgi:hypothetical protein